MFNFLGEEISIKQTIRKHLVTEVLSSNLKKKGLAIQKVFITTLAKIEIKLKKPHSISCFRSLMSHTSLSHHSYECVYSDTPKKTS